MPRLVSTAERRRRKRLNDANPPAVLRSRGRLRPHKPKPHAALYGSERWQRLRDRFLRQSPLCGGCGAIARDVHHVVRHRGDHDLFFDASNLMSVCEKCHAYITEWEQSPSARYPSPHEPERVIRARQSGDHGGG